MKPELVSVFLNSMDRILSGDPCGPVSCSSKNSSISCLGPIAAVNVGVPLTGQEIFVSRMLAVSAFAILATCRQEPLLISSGMLQARKGEFKMASPYFPHLLIATVE